MNLYVWGMCITADGEQDTQVDIAHYWNTLVLKTDERDQHLSLGLLISLQENIFFHLTMDLFHCY